MLKTLRIVAATICFVMVTLLFLDFTGVAHAWFGFMAKVQLLPAILAMNVGVVAALLLLTLLLGRLYCSVICPLGIMQDIFFSLGLRRKRNRCTSSPAKNRLRYAMLALFIVALVAHIGIIAQILAPYSSFGRIATNLFAPLWALGNNALAYIAERIDSYAFYSTEVWRGTLLSLALSIVMFVGIGVLAWRNGRTWCNTVCPVGTVLGFVSRFSLFKIVIDKERCTGCKLCARNCKAACIDPAAHAVDYSRCVVCFDCIGKCRTGAIAYRFRFGKKGASKAEVAEPKASSERGLSRRKFLSLIGIATATSVVRAQEKKVDGGLAVIVDKRVPDRATPVLPAGAQSLRNMTAHCTGCQLCVAACPSKVLRPSGGVMTFMQPVASFENGYCRTDCVRCSEVCPAGAIKPITVAEKSSIQTGHAVWVKANCVVLTDGVSCGNCARHCPAGAISMAHAVEGDSSSPMIPIINEERCIGCGACEFHCPSRPFSAIYVEGHEVHRFI